jgi:hypothetical protein
VEHDLAIRGDSFGRQQFADPRQQRAAIARAVARS